VPIVTGTWATVDEVLELTGVTVTEQQLVAGQAALENHIRRVYRSSDALSSDGVWLKRACCYQSVWLKDHPELFNRVKFTSTSQDGWSITYPDNGSDDWISPQATNVLNNLRAGANTSIRVNSGFQPASGFDSYPRSRWRRL
jgi:hypothetical protein